MKKLGKAGVLIFVLVLPVFIILFLNLFAENHFSLPYLLPKLESDGQVKMNGKDTVFVPLANQNDGKIKVVAFFTDSTGIITQNFARIEKRTAGNVTLRHERGDLPQAVEKYALDLLKKPKLNQTINYQEQFILIDKQGFVRGIYDATDPVETDRLLAEVAILIDIYEKEKK